MKNVSNILLKIFAAGVLLTLFAGALAFLGYGIALLVGGAFATELCLFIYEDYFPVVIQICSVSVAFGLVGMYLSKMKALSFAQEETDKES